MGQRKFLTNPLTFLVVVCLILVACVSEGMANLSSGRSDGYRRGYFISIDGLSPSRLESLIDADVLNAPYGFSWLARNSVRAKRAHSVVTLTAPSHVSTITCSRPSVHGVIANNFLEDGVMQNGFNHAVAAETFWQAAMRQGRKVVTIAYVGADGATTDRTPTWGVGYPNPALLSPSQVVNIAAGQSDGEIRVTLNPKTQESRLVYFKVHLRESKVQVVFDDDRNPENGVLGMLTDSAVGQEAFLHVYFVENDGASETAGFKRRVWFRLLAGEAGGVRIYVSKSSYTNAFPAEFRRALERDNLVWPDYGLTDKSMSKQEIVQAYSIIDRYLMSVARYAQSHLDFDLMLFYQPLIDTVGHQWEGVDDEDDVRAAFLEAYAVVDRNLSAILGHKGPEDVIALMGDHGMAPVLRKVNAATLLSAQELTQIHAVASGAMLMVYDNGDEAKANAVAMALADRLKAAIFAGMPVFDQAIYRDKAGVGRGAWDYGDAVAVFFPTAKFWFEFNPLGNELFVMPPIWGMHGHLPEVDEMETTFMLHGREVPPRVVEEFNLIDTVPTVGRILGLTPPRQCQGRSRI